ncbi:hypothetical protein TNCV_2282301 [Trichonephila clavipes]|nr:hypothetical protein TNCV_2282301 [Trichonephila clavipes]
MTPPNYHTTARGGRLSSRQNVHRSPRRRVFSRTGLELVTSQLRSDTLTTRLPRQLGTVSISQPLVLAFPKEELLGLLPFSGQTRGDDIENALKTKKNKIVSIAEEPEV